MIWVKRPVLGLWDDISAGVSTATNAATSAISGQSLGDIADTVGNGNIQDLVDLGGNVLGNLTPAQVAAGVTPGSQHAKPGLAVPMSPQALSTTTKVGLSTATVAMLAVGAYFLLGE